MNEESFGDQMVAQMPYLRAFAISLCGSHSLADDLVQDTLVKAWSHADSFQPNTNLRAWLVTILRNTYFSSYRKRSREVQDSDNLLAQQIPVKGGQESALTLADVQSALDKLAPEHKEILLMIGITELSYEEAAEICGVAIGTVKSRLNRARAKLAEHLGLLTPNDIDTDPTVSDLAARRPSRAI
ncbi:sigma-70 family RNA polymerase sigma factor [Methylocystis sp. B8]|uniref:sigma-70 family RNA polymerase sigma factor n=1 Tax=Methylocystis sp. B8 TaxID=544938 RepID=UPI0010FD5894|nr:sigma-70 family RNA polymerase sigma factor [Methylocystis sp. B8]TLG77027.1 sigma-70 family RNA polymerase sigma factor [Methylocystis sp. B8]